MSLSSNLFYGSFVSLILPTFATFGMWHDLMSETLKFSMIKLKSIKIVNKQNSKKASQDIPNTGPKYMTLKMDLVFSCVL